MNKKIVVLFYSLTIPLCVKADPYQFLKYESAVLTKKGHFEFKFNGMFENGYIPTHAYLLQLRYGLFKGVDLSVNGIYAQFKETNTNRFTSMHANLKTRLRFLDMGGFKMVNYIKFRMAFGDPYLQLYDGPTDDVRQVVSPYADGGKDLIIGLLGRKKMNKLILTTGFEYARVEGRDYFNFEDDQKNILSMIATPQIHFMKEKFLMACETRFTHWFNRGSYFEAIPQIRWELIPQWVAEVGVSLPVYGGTNYQLCVGLTYEIK